MEACSNRFSKNFLKITKDKFSNLFQNWGFRTESSLLEVYVLLN